VTATPPRADPAPSAKQIAVRYAAERYVEGLIVDAMASYGEHNWREDLGPALVAQFRVWFDYDGPKRRLMLAGPWEDDPDV
jgi:hypothetical protein